MGKKYSKPLDIFQDLFNGEPVYLHGREYTLGKDNKVYIVAHRNNKSPVLFNNFFSLNDFIALCFEECKNSCE
jgi:hypothetical protein